MSALAKLMILTGNTVTGSDRRYSPEAESLTEWGAYVYVGADAAIIKSADLVVYSQAIPSDDPELGFCREFNVKTVRRDYFLAEVAATYDFTVAVAGTHGKTTVTAMLSKIFKESGELYTAHIGGNTFDAGNLVYKGDKFFITEACEYKRSFLALRPDVAVILNVEPDHPDTYRSKDELFAAFTSFICNLRRGGVAVVNADTEFYRMNKCTYKDMYTFSVDTPSDCRAVNIKLLSNGRYGFSILHKGYPNVDVSLKIAGKHNVQNALAAYLAATVCGLKRDVIVRGLESFGGVAGRYEFKGYCSGAEVYTDYAHHPTEIRAAVSTALASGGKGRVIAVFQPHTLSRTEALFDGFLHAFCDADAVFVFKEYKARETSGGKDAYALYEGLKERRDEVYYFDDIIALANAVTGYCAPGDVLLVLGAGDISSLASLIV